MKYFNALPRITQNDTNNNTILVNNLVSRCYFLPSLMKNVMLFYDYDIKEGDTPENIAYRYYNNSYRYWLLLYSNNIIDPQSQWPLNNNIFDDHIFNKYKQDASDYFDIPVSTIQLYKVVEYTKLTTHHYEQKITIINSEDLQRQVTTIIVDEDTYSSVFDYSEEYTFNDGTSLTKTMQRRIVSIYDYEYDLNESKRKIQIVKDSFVNEAEEKFQSLMRM